MEDILIYFESPYFLGSSVFPNARRYVFFFLNCMYSTILFLNLFLHT